MERLVERNNFIFRFLRGYGLSDLTGELEGCLIGFGATIANEGSRCGGEATGSMCELYELF